MMREVMREFPNFVARAGTMNRADPWIICHARISGACVVTDEQRAERPKATKPPKIPNVCDHYGLECITPAEFLEQAGFSL